MTVPERLIPAPWYSEDGVYVFQYIELMEIIKKMEKIGAKEFLRQRLPDLLKKTEKFYESEFTTAHNKSYYGDAVEHTRKAIREYESGSAKIIMFYGNYQDENKRTMFVFEK